MDGPLGEHCHLVGGEPVFDECGPVLGDEFGAEFAFDDDVDLGGAGVCVRGVKSTRSQKAHCHADAGADEGGEGLAVGFDSVPAQTGGDGVIGGGVEEVVDMVGGVGKELYPVDGGGGVLEGGDQGEVVGVGDRLGAGGECRRILARCNGLRDRYG